MKFKIIGCIVIAVVVLVVYVFAHAGNQAASDQDNGGEQGQSQAQ